MPSIHPITIRRLLLGLLILLPLQYAIAGLVQFLSGREPWPVLVMPGFKATWDGHAPLLAPKVTFIAHYADGTSKRLSADTVLAPLPYSHHQAMLAAFFQPASLSGTPATERVRNPDASSWLQSRLQALTGATPVRVDIVWEEIRYKPNAFPTLQSSPLDTLSLSWQ